uniref:Striatin N-terminal domain-containing protein n=1 Tax=Phlebotomus papatasi TaxID=29031 RepID=A0A1B0D7U7_PHLPP
MDENSSSLGHQNGGGGMSGVVVSSQMGGNNSTAINNKGQDDNQTNQTSGPPHHYSIPGILHFIQHEWARFEHERSQWDVDRAELQVRDGVFSVCRSRKGPVFEWKREERQKKSSAPPSEIPLENIKKKKLPCQLN